VSTLSATLTIVSTLVLGTDTANGVGGGGGNAGDGEVGDDGREVDEGRRSMINTGLHEANEADETMLEFVPFCDELWMSVISFEASTFKVGEEDDVEDMEDEISLCPPFPAPVWADVSIVSVVIPPPMCTVTLSCFVSPL
jgi:hypothetical protein